MRSFRLLLLAGLAACLPVAAWATPLTIADGNFATPSAGRFTTYDAGSTAIAGWTVAGASVDLIGSYWQAPPGGGQSVDLDGNAPGGLTQTLATVPGETYEISFALSGNPDGGTPTKALTVSAGAYSQAYTYTTGSNTYANMKYATETFTFTASGASTALNFVSDDTGSSPWGPVIGDIVAVPEPLSVLVFGAALAGLGLARRRSV